MAIVIFLIKFFYLFKNVSGQSSNKKFASLHYVTKSRLIKVILFFFYFRIIYFYIQ